MLELLPQVPEATRALACDLIATTFSSVAKEFSGSPRTEAQITAYADAMADMFGALHHHRPRCGPRRGPGQRQ